MYQKPISRAQATFISPTKEPLLIRQLWRTTLTFTLIWFVQPQSRCLIRQPMVTVTRSRSHGHGHTVTENLRALGEDQSLGFQINEWQVSCSCMIRICRLSDERVGIKAREALGEEDQIKWMAPFLPIHADLQTSVSESKPVARWAREVEHLEHHAVVVGA